MDLENGSLPEKPLREVLPWKLPGCLQLFIPISGLAGNMLFITKLAGESILRPDGINRVLLVGSGNPLIGMSACPA